MSSDPNDDLKRVARAMLKDFESLMTSITDRVWQTIPAYSSLILEQSDLRDRIRENVQNVILCMLEGREPSTAELTRSAKNGERRALQGVSHASLIQSFRTAERTLTDEFQLWCARMQLKPARARLGRNLLIDNLDRIERAMLDAYEAMQQQIDASNQLTEPTLFNRLAVGATIAPGEVEQLGRLLGIDDTEQTRFIAIALTTGGADATVLERLRHHVVFQLTAALRTPVLSGTVGGSSSPVALIALPWSQGSDALLPHIDAAISDTMVEIASRAAVGEPRVGLGQLSLSCRQALSALEATEATAESRKAIRYADSLLEVLVRRDPPLVRQLSDRYLGPLAGTELEETLRCHVATNLSLSKTATLLHVHRNTIVYRLRRIEELTGLDLHDVGDLSRVVLALAATPNSGNDAAG
ncbi:PucR family transcriptional regulator [Amnibacterium flavum]|uniref:PucR family transcriptional regulator n=1 Tax=Amnibacterium flavum TaxID=2173173 RepID=A0A2V1HP84_9MICO|nr:PucR family transcriptional regulator [Amnibacterium flavum]PVZ94141.1 hypothetical protein DDQ50_10355 [Amnibacterium flavum]